MRIVRLDHEPADVVPYLSAASGGGIVSAVLPVHTGTIDGLPAGLDALIVASDLQGACAAGLPGSPDTEGLSRLLGEELAERLELLLRVEFPEVDLQKSLALLCGDLYADPAVRGSSGDPLPVWRAFARSFGAVAGVAGNHDLLPPGGEEELDGAEGIVFFGSPGVREAAGARIGGIGGITGRSGRPNRMPEERFLRELRRLLARGPDILLMHQGPDIPAQALRGHEGVRERIENGPPLLLCCGHVHWERPLAELGTAQVLNADGRAFVLTRA
ncbi:metallophosphoesterase family protein [Saccharibacillus alkalitolerans]|uniref:Metallophosphoesterase n=1 Tax=Saccharibacillus alkalitolerans TaxID=2705290 RepID=A0ABX0F2K8_9BACL|nr:metallophosphoesterase [Saccharibacillus alkalitolerans]NGZ74259.1 metallophosphoesterase [Saccharibacillus alkalitolerans]